MIRGIVAGLVSGVALVVVGLAAVSLIAPLPQRPAEPASVVAPAAPVSDVAAPQEPVAEAASVEPSVPEASPGPAPETTAEPAPEATPEPAAEAGPVPSAPAADPAPAPALRGGQVPVLAPPAEGGEAAPAAVAPEAPSPQGGAPAAPAPAGEDVAGTDGATTPVAPRPVGPPPALTQPARPAGGAPVLPSTDAAPGQRTPAAPALAEAERPDDGPRILPPAPLPPPAAKAPDPEPAPAAEADAAPASRPEPGFSSAVDGVRTGRLPTIAPAAEATQDTPPAGALLRNARAFANPDNKPPFAILLLDQGGTIVDLSTLAASDLPLTLIVDPALPDAAQRAALWRAAGQEVALSATALPRRGAAADMEVAMEALSADFQGALAIADLRETSAQGDRAWASALVPALAARGFGMVSMDRGLNVADQVARREGLPAAIIFRELDAKDESAAVIRRYLDRAAFKAQQDGRAIVVGRVRPETITAVLEWALEGRAATLALAPLSAVFPAQ